MFYINQRLPLLVYKRDRNPYSLLQMLEERKERDHRKIGKELELFSNNPLVGAGLPLVLYKSTFAITGV
jgi:threonyl-tRNA synthetase